MCVQLIPNKTYQLLLNEEEESLNISEVLLIWWCISSHARALATILLIITPNVCFICVFLSED
jgi:hypothetical protein